MCCAHQGNPQTIPGVSKRRLLDRPHYDQSHPFGQRVARKHGRVFACLPNNISNALAPPPHRHPVRVSSGNGTWLPKFTRRGYRAPDLKQMFLSPAWLTNHAQSDVHRLPASLDPSRKAPRERNPRTPESVAELTAVQVSIVRLRRPMLLDPFCEICLSHTILYNIYGVIFFGCERSCASSQKLLRTTKAEP